MLHKCANPACLTPFRKLSQGKLFLLETDPVERSDSKRANWRSQGAHRVEYYWLCDQCAIALTLFYEKGQGVVTVARMNAARKAAAAAVRGADLSQREAGRTEQSA